MKHDEGLREYLKGVYLGAYHGLMAATADRVEDCRRELYRAFITAITCFGPSFGDELEQAAKEKKALPV